MLLLGLQLLVVTLVTNALELKVLAQLLDTPPAASAALRLHAAVALCLLAWTHVWGKTPCVRTEDGQRFLHWQWLFAGSVAVLGPLGAIPGTVVLLFWGLSMPRAISFETWYDGLFPQYGPLAEDLEYRVVAQRLEAPITDLLVVPFADVLAYGDQSDKHYVISLIVRDFHPQFAGVLRQALNDDDSSVRIQAATAFGNLEKAFVNRTMCVAHAARGNAEQALSLARVYDDYAFSGLLDERRALDLRRQALRMFGKWLREHGYADSDVCIAMGRLLVRTGRYRAAARWLERYGRCDTMTTPWLPWYLEALFRNADYGTLRDVIAANRAVYARTPLPAELQTSLRMWS